MMNGLRNKIGLAFGVATAAVAAWLILTPLQWRDAVHSYESRFTPPPGVTEPAAASRGRLFLENDSYYWIDYARKMAATGSWRIRHTRFDNPPDGRPVHWSQSISWLLVLYGRLQHAVTGEPLHVAIESSAIWIGPSLFFILIACTGYLLLRRAGLIPSLLWMFNLLTLPAIQWSFHPLRPDHHGLHLGFLLSSLLCLVLGGLGWVRTSSDRDGCLHLFVPLQPPDRRRARRLFAAAGILGGLGLWTGATVQLSGIALFSAGAVLLVLLQARRNTGDSAASQLFDPSVWRWWAVAGAATSLVCYLLEYAPSFPGMRLEVNHPLYALSWFCAGELVARLTVRPARRVVVVLFAAGALLLPALLLFGPPEWHTLRDPIMRRMHLFIDEFRPYFAVHRSSRIVALLASFGVLPIVLAAAPYLVRRGKLTAYEQSAAGICLLAALSYAALTAWQARWANFFAATALLMAVIILPMLWRTRNGQASLVVVLTATMLLQPIGFLALQFRDIHFRDISTERVGELAAPILQRQLAERLGALNTNGAFRIMGGPHMAARLHYYGGLPNVSSYYWENIGGLRAAAEFLAAEDDAEALRIARQRGITHVILPPSADFVRMFYYIRNGSFSEPGARDCLAGRLLTRPDAAPRWIKRDARFERDLQPGYLFAGEPIFGTLVVYTIEQETPGQTR